MKPAVVAPTKDQYLSEIIGMMSSQLMDAQAAIAKFKEKFDKNPYHSLHFGTGIFEAVAKEKVLREMLEAVTAPDTKVTPSRFYAYVLDQMARGASSPRRSTCPASNLLDQCTASAWADLYDLCRVLA